MTFDEMKRILEEYIDTKKYLKAQERRIAELRAKIDGLSAVDYSHEKVIASASNSYVEGIILRLIELEEDLSKTMAKMFAEEDMIAERMKECTQLEQAMLIDRYMNQWSWKRICKHYHYSYNSRGAVKAVNKAVKKMSKD